MVPVKVAADRRIDSLLKDGASAFMAGDINRGLEGWEAALLFLNRSADHQRRLELLRRLAFAHRKAGHIARARELLEAQCKGAAEVKDSKELAMGHHALGLLFFEVGDEISAEQNWVRAADLGRYSNLPTVLSDALACVASLRSGAGLYGEAETLLAEALRAAESGGSAGKLADVHDDLARLHLSIGRGDSAVVHARNAADAFRRAGDEQSAERVIREFLA